MKTFLSSLFANGDTLPLSKSTVPNRDNPPTIEDGSENGTRRQLVQVLLRDALRRHGIPPDWIACQMLLVSSRTRGNGMYMRLILKHWDARIMNYMVALEKVLIKDIERFEPKAREWLHGISWQLEVGDSCPYAEMPEKSFWLPGAVDDRVAGASAAAINPPAPTQRRVERTDVLKGQQ